MEKTLQEVAQRIREMREVFGISTKEMADVTGVSTAEYENLEAGNADFTFTFIYKCAQRFGLDITDLLKGSSPRLTSYCVNRKGSGLPIARRRGFRYNNIAPQFKDKIAEPFIVTAKYSDTEQNESIHTSSHEGQEFDLVISGSLKVMIDDHIEILDEGDSIYYDSATPHGMIATGGSDCKFLAVVMNNGGKAYEYPEEVTKAEAPRNTSLLNPLPENPVAYRYIDVTEYPSGKPKSVTFKNNENYNFAFDTVDAIAEKCPNKVAMIHVSRDQEERVFTFAQIRDESCRVANYFESLGIKRGDRVMLVLKRHYQFWLSILALHRIGAIVIPATNMLVEHDFDYRFRAAGISAIICTADGSTAAEAEAAADKCGFPNIRVVAHGERKGWHSFDLEYPTFSEHFDRPDGVGGDEPMLMFFTSGTTGYPKIALHSYNYVLGHFITARYWHNVDPNGLHFTISDTGWGKALWGKLYGQWLCECAVFVYDFDKFNADDILKKFAKYHITTFCAPPTMYRFFIKEDLSKYDLSSVKYATIAGEALNPEVFYKFKEATGLSLMEGFGQTETTLVVANFVGDTPKPGSMGHPSPLYDVDIQLADGTPAPVGETGEIVIKTSGHPGRIPGLYLGYYNDEMHTRESWHDGYYHTGDTAWRDEDGNFWYVGRIDDLIKSSGYRIGPFEIESVIMELPYVVECAVTAAPDEIRGQVVKASIVLTKDKIPSDELKREIQNYVKEHTAPYKYPRIVEFLDEMPKTISGKIRRVDLRKN